MRLALEAMRIAVLWHGDQKRKYDGTPYVAHPVQVAQLVEDAGWGEAVIAAALLHDVLEDTSMTMVNLTSLIGAEVAGMVWQLSDFLTPEDGNRATRKQKERVRLANANASVQTIKLADLIDNTSSITKVDPNFARVYMREKALLLEVLTEGDANLRRRAQSQLNHYFALER